MPTASLVARIHPGPRSSRDESWGERGRPDFSGFEIGGLMF
jgi:hypothetical protein